MQKTILYILGLLVIVIGGFFLLNSYIYNEKRATVVNHYKDAQYLIDGKRIQLVKGQSEIEAGFASKIVTKYFGNEVKHDFNGDGREDVAFLLTQETGGTGIFYYVVAALNTDKGYVGSQALFLGDRISPQTTELGKGNTVVINYADRAFGEDFSVRPSVGKSIWLLLDSETLQFGEVASDFEGEADPALMTLGMKKWTWVSALYNDGQEIKPREKGAFTITFGDKSVFSATTDCNSVGGQYSASKETIAFTQIYATKMYCEGSQESTFTELLGNSAEFHFTSRGELVLDLKFNSGTVIFR
ncbi:MAG: META domain-containing protein [Patescibacteria group bacterium]